MRESYENKKKPCWNQINFGSLRNVSFILKKVPYILSKHKYSWNAKKNKSYLLMLNSGGRSIQIIYL